MAEAGDPKQDLKWVIFIFVIFGLLWWLMGGVERARREEPKPFIAPPTDLRSAP